MMIFQLFFDAAILSLILHIVAPWERTEWRKHLALGLALGVLNFVLVLLLAKPLGYGALAVVLIADGLLIAKFCYLPAKHTAITVGSFVAVKILISLAFSAMFATGDGADHKAQLDAPAPTPVVSQMC